MQIYSSDLTPMLMRYRRYAGQGPLRTYREGGSAVEWCLHKAYYMWRQDSGELVCRTVFEPPIHMASKKTWDLFAVATRMLPFLPDWHPRGISISWHMFDRGQRKACARALRRRHLLEYQKSIALDNAASLS